jgi:DNA polymerase-3 subunit delta'
MSTPAPRETAELFGHEAAERVLRTAWDSGRLPHAWLIGGIGGIGKATLAFRFARFVLAREGDGAAAGAAAASGPGLFGALPEAASPGLFLPPDHPVFRRVRAGGHADLLTIERRFDDKRGRMKTEIAVDDVREVTAFLRRTSGEGGWRVVVIDGVDRMNASGHNALLKILEEPPARALLLLVTEAPGGLLPTIRSRCRKLALEPLTEAAVRLLLDRHRAELPEADRAALARLAEGSIGHALTLADAGGLDLYRQMVAVLGTLPRLDQRAAHAFAEALGRKSDEAFETASGLLVWWLTRLIRSGARGTAAAEVVPGEAALISRLLGQGGDGGLDRWLDVWEKITQVFARAEAVNLDRKQVVLNALLGIEAATS